MYAKVAYVLMWHAPRRRNMLWRPISNRLALVYLYVRTSTCKTIGIRFQQFCSSTKNRCKRLSHCQLLFKWQYAYINFSVYSSTAVIANTTMHTHTHTHTHLTSFITRGVAGVSPRSRWCQWNKWSNKAHWLTVAQSSGVWRDSGSPETQRPRNKHLKIMFIKDILILIYEYIFHGKQTCGAEERSRVCKLWFEVWYARCAMELCKYVEIESMKDTYDSPRTLPLCLSVFFMCLVRK